jgi:predicted dehydrogenase
MDKEVGELMEKLSGSHERGEITRLGVIGLGLIGGKHAEIARQNDECILVAVSDVDRTAKTRTEELGAEFYMDYREMIEREELDGVIIAVPNDLHAPVGIACVRKGIHIFVEKPIASSIADADSLIETARQNNVCLLVGHHRRFNPLVETTRKVVRGGQIGTLVGVNVLWTLLKPPDYFLFAWRKQKGGGPILINLIHEIDNLRYICGEITRVYAEVSNKVRKFPVEDSASVSLRFESGALGTVLTSDCVSSIWSYEANNGENPYYFHSAGNCYYFFGTEASFTFPGLKRVYYPSPDKAGWQYPILAEEGEVVRADPLREQLKHFCRVAKGLESPRTTGEDARKTLEVVLAILESGETGKPVSLNPAT